jgi:hypothetical protein
MCRASKVSSLDELLKVSSLDKLRSYYLMAGQADFDFLQEQGFPPSFPHTDRIWNNLRTKY